MRGKKVKEKKTSRDIDQHRLTLTLITIVVTKELDLLRFPTRGLLNDNDEKLTGNTIFRSQNLRPNVFNECSKYIDLRDTF